MRRSSFLNSMYEFIILLFFFLQSECRIILKKHSGENIVLQAVMDEFEEQRNKENLTAELLNREKVRSRTYIGFKNSKILILFREIIFTKIFVKLI